jgi:hypothetical protein
VRSLLSKDDAMKGVLSVGTNFRSTSVEVADE